jgi:hypothetical protein
MKIDANKSTVILGPPGCICGTAEICLNRFGKVYQDTLSHLFQQGLKPFRPTNGKRVIATRSLTAEGLFRLNEIVGITSSGIRDTIVVSTNTKQLALTPDHLVLTPDRGWLQTGALSIGASVYVEATVRREVPGVEKVVALADGGKRETFDLRMKSPDNNFIANGIVVHNCGKTERLISEVESALASGSPPNKIGFISFTKKAAEEAKARASEKFSIPPEDLHYFRTIHSLCFNHLGMQRDRVFNWKHQAELGRMLGLEFKGREHLFDDSDVYGMGMADRMLFLDGLARNQLKPLYFAWNDANEDEISWPELERFSRALEQFKLSRGLCDFTDMVERFNQSSMSVLPRFDKLIVDEVQDLSLLQWRAVELLAENAKQLYFAGDDCQCHPVGEQILTANRGFASVEDLRPNQDTLVYWRRDTHCFHGFNQLPGIFQIAERYFDGELVVISVNGEVTRVTPDHKLVVRFINMDQVRKCVYVMRRGNDYMVGQCQMFGPINNTQFWSRVRYEKGDAIWILKTTLDPIEAMVMEQKVSMMYGLPQICFKPQNDTLHDSQEVADRVFNELDTRSSAERCLKDFSLLIDYPFFTASRAREKSGGTSIFKLEAVNLLPEIMAVPSVTNFRIAAVCAWSNISVSREPYTGKVFSLNVDRWHTYVANNIAVCNCIYKWSGADVESFIELPGKQISLDQSYRVPASVHDLADSISDRISNKRPRSWRARPEKGEVRWHRSVEEVDLSKGSWLLLGRNGYMLRELEDYCMTEGFSFSSVSRNLLKGKSLAAIVSWENLRKGRDEPTEKVLEVLSMMPAQLVPIALVKWLRAEEPSRMVGMPELREKGLATTAIWHECMTKIPTRERDYFIAVRRRGEPLLKTPRISINTIHSVKGAQADHVLLLTDMSHRTYQKMQEQYEDECRVWYVGSTRCKETLNVVMPRTNLSFDL